MENLTLESRLLAVVLMFTLLVAVSLLITFYTEIAGKPTEKNMVTGVLLGFVMIKFFLLSLNSSIIVMIVMISIKFAFQ